MQSLQRQRAEILQTPGFIIPPTIPFHVTASSVLSSNSSGGVNAVALKNPLGDLPCEILEIRWQLIGPNFGSGGNTVGGIIGCKLTLGKFPLTNGFVPVWNFSRSDNLSQEFITDGVRNKTFCEYTWALPKPLYVPAGAVVAPSFQHRGLLQDDIEVRISYSGRSFPAGTPPPKKIRLPYAAFWASKVFDAEVLGTDNSLETDLVNPFNETLHLQRFTGRCLSTQDDFTTEGAFFESIPSQALIVRMVDSYGRPIIKNFTPFRQAFSAVTRSWEMERGQVMDPNSYYQFFVRNELPTQGPPETPILSQLFVGLIGWRQIVGGGEE